MAPKSCAGLPRRLTLESPGSLSQPQSLRGWHHGTAAVESRGNHVSRLFRPYFQALGFSPSRYASALS